MALSVLLAWALQAEGLEAELAKARESHQPVCLVLVDEGAAKGEPDLGKGASGFVVVRAKGKRPANLLDLPFPALAIVEPVFAPRKASAEELFLQGPCRGRLTVAGELTAQQNTLMESLRTVGRGGRQKVGPMALESCFSVVNGWARVRLGVEEDPVVLDPSVSKTATVEFQGGADHTFESIYRAFAEQNRWVLYPADGRIVLSTKLPRAVPDPAAVERFLAKHAEPEELPPEELRKYEDALRRLEDDDPTTRVEASRQLADAGARARRLLRKALTGAQALDLRTRLENLLRP
jgi:hypothetical protein